MPQTTKPTIESTLSSLTFDEIIHAIRRRKFLVLSILSWITMAALFVGVIIPQVRAIFQVFSDMKTQETALNDLKTKSDFLSGLDPTELQTQLSLMQAALPAAKPVVPLLSTIQSIAGESVVSINNFQLSPGDVATQSAGSTKTNIAALVPGVLTLPLKMEVSGDFATINSFFQHLDVVVPLLNVSSIQFSPYTLSKTATTSAGLYRASVQLQSLYIQQDTTKDTPLTPLTSTEQQLLQTISQSVASYSGQQVVQITPIGSGSATRTDIFQRQ